MGFFRRFFSKSSSVSESQKDSEGEEAMLTTLERQYHRDIEEDVASIESILDDKEEKPQEEIALPAPDYDGHEASAEDVLVDSEMENFSEKNVVEHSSIEDLGNHLESASIIGDLPSAISFDSPE